jgi:hypothetical protein
VSDPDHFEKWRLDFEARHNIDRSDKEKRLANTETAVAVLDERVSTVKTEQTKLVTKAEFAPIHWTFVVVGGGVITAIIGAAIKHLAWFS